MSATTNDSPRFVPVCGACGVRAGICKGGFCYECVLQGLRSSLASMIQTFGGPR